jgi:hypothetical protein
METEVHVVKKDSPWVDSDDLNKCGAQGEQWTGTSGAATEADLAQDWDIRAKRVRIVL